MGIQTREVIGLYLDPELKEYLDSKFDSLEKHIEGEFGNLGKEKQQVN